MNEYKPLSKEEVEKIRRRQKAEGIISGISDAAQAVDNLWTTSQYAPNMYNANEGMSAKAKARFEKEEADRKAKDAEFFNYAMTLGKVRDADKDRGLQIWQTEQALSRQDRAYDASRQDRAEDVAFRNKDFDERVREWQESFNREGVWHEEEVERWERQFQESIRQFNVTTSLQRQQLNLTAKQLSNSMKQGQMTFNLGSGLGNVTLSADKLNAQTIAYIYSTLPQKVRAQVKGDPIVQNGIVVGNKPPTPETMLIAIGTYVATSPSTQRAIKEVAGFELDKKPKAY